MPISQERCDSCGYDHALFVCDSCKKPCNDGGRTISLGTEPKIACDACFEVIVKLFALTDDELRYLPRIRAQ